MFKKLLLVMLIGCMVASLAVAASAADLVTKTRIGNPDADLVLEWWVQPDYCHRSHIEARKEAFTEVYQEWAEEHPNVQIKINIMPELEQFKNKLMMAASKGNAPDMSSVDSFWVPWFYSRGYLQPLNEFFTEEQLDDFFPFIKNGVSDVEGSIYALWHSTDMRALFYRKDLISDPPRTWDELIEVGKEIKEEHPNMTPFLYNGGRWEGTTFDNLAYFWAQGGDLVDMETGRPVFNEGENREYMINTLEFLERTVETGVSPRRVATITNYDQFEPGIQSDDLAMFLGGSWQAEDIRRLVGEDAEKWEIALIPQKTEDIAATGTGGWTWGIFTEDPEKQKAAFDFFMYQMTTENMGKISKATGTLPTRDSVYEEVAYFSEDRFYKQYGEMLQYGRPRPGVAIYPKISEELQVAINTILTSNTSAEEALDRAWDNVMRDYKD